MNKTATATLEEARAKANRVTVKVRASDRRWLTLSNRVFDAIAEPFLEWADSVINVRLYEEYVEVVLKYKGLRFTLTYPTMALSLPWSKDFDLVLLCPKVVQS